MSDLFIALGGLYCAIGSTGTILFFRACGIAREQPRNDVPDPRPVERSTPVLSASERISITEFQ